MKPVSLVAAQANLESLVFSWRETETHAEGGSCYRRRLGHRHFQEVTVISVFAGSTVETLGNARGCLEDEDGRSKERSQSGFHG
jgi:hypothetical protein